MEPPFFGQTALKLCDVYRQTRSHPFFYQQGGETIRLLRKIKAIHPKVKFVTNATMYGTPGYIPIGLYIENGKRVAKAQVFNDPSVNFGMQPQGVFPITKENKALIVPIQLLVIGGKVNPKLTGSDSRYIRSGYGILKDGRVLFALSEERVTFQQFARFFLEKGCTEAVYIDGAVSDYWTSEHEPHPMAQFGVIVGAY